MKTKNKTVSENVRPARRASPLTFKSILVPTDFSAPASQALRYAVALAKETGAKLTLLNVIEPIGPTPDFAYNPMVMEDEKVTAAAKAQLHRLVEKEGLTAALVEKTPVRHGIPFHEISGAAATLKSDLIVLATHGYTGFKHILLGSTAERVVRHAPCPVLVVRAEER